MSYILEALRKSEQARSGKATLAAGVSAPRGPARRARPSVWIGVVLLMAVVAWGGWWLGRSAAPPVATHVPAAPLDPATAQAPEPRPPAVVSDPASSVPAARVTTTAAPPAPLRLRPLPPVPDVAPSGGTAAQMPSGAAQREPQNEAPAWSELPPEQRGRVTRPRIDVHVHAEDPLRRFVLIDLKRYREGDRLPSGARLERIEADGILLDDNGIRYRVPRP